MVVECSNTADGVATRIGTLAASMYRRSPSSKYGDTQQTPGTHVDLNPASKKKMWFPAVLSKKKQTPAFERFFSFAYSFKILNSVMLHDMNLYLHFQRLLDVFIQTNLYKSFCL